MENTVARLAAFAVNYLLRYCTIVFCTAMVSCSGDPKNVDWPVAGGSRSNTRYSELQQIDTSNVTQLKPVWVYHTGDADTLAHSEIQCNPVIINGILYATSPKLKVIALDAASGKLKWQFDPADSTVNKRWYTQAAVNSNRGVTYWEDSRQQRILYTAGSILYALDARTGKPVEEFGDHGGLDLHKGLGRNVSDLYLAPTSPGIIYKDLYIIGGRVNEGVPAAPGHIRAFNVLTGKQQWIFHTIPQPGEYGYASWADAAAYRFIGGANNWSGFSLDEKRGILFAPTGSASFDFYGGKRVGDGLFANCLIALDAATGKRLWHFQTVHHDVWDRDLPTPPALVTVVINGKSVDAVAQPTKQGFVFLFNRETGIPLYEIKERAVPSVSELKGEVLSRTQPVPVLPKPFARQSLTEADLNRFISESSYLDSKQQLAGYNSGNVFNPPSKKGTVIFPGFDGGAEWGGSAFDESSGLLYINSNEVPWVLTMLDAKPGDGSGENFLQAGERLYKRNCMSCHGVDRQGSGNFPSLIGVGRQYGPLQFHDLLITGRRMMPSFRQLTEQEKNAIASFVLELKEEQIKDFSSEDKEDSSNILPYYFTGYQKFLTKEGYPAVKPPWGTLNAINLNTGEIAWKIPLGEYKELSEQGIPVTGTENYGGPVVTAGGVLFIAATRDGKFRGINKRSGKVLWETDLPFPGFATPSVYAVGGKQYIVIACGGGKLHTRSGDAYMAFALP